MIDDLIKNQEFDHNLKSNINLAIDKVISNMNNKRVGPMIHINKRGDIRHLIQNNEKEFSIFAKESYIAVFHEDDAIKGVLYDSGPLIKLGNDLSSIKLNHGKISGKIIKINEVPDSDVNKFDITIE